MPRLFSSQVLKPLKLSFSLILLALTLSACYIEMACTAIFSFYTITVTDSDNRTVTLDSLSITNLDSGERYPICQDTNDPGPCLGRENIVGEGSYEIMSDNFMASLKRSGSTIRVEGSKDEHSFSQDYVFGSDGCHMVYVSGPATIQLGNQGIAISLPRFDLSS